MADRPFWLNGVPQGRKSCVLVSPRCAADESVRPREPMDSAGIRGAAPFPMVTLRLVTPAPHRGFRNGCNCPSCKADLTRLAARRAHCEACGGDRSKCLEGQGPEGDFELLEGCMAFTSTGKIRRAPPKKAKKIRQPWEPRKAA